MSVPHHCGQFSLMDEGHICQYTRLDTHTQGCHTQPCIYTHKPLILQLLGWQSSQWPSQHALRCCWCHIVRTHINHLFVYTLGAQSCTSVCFQRSGFYTGLSELKHGLIWEIVFFFLRTCTFYTSTCVMLSSDQPLSDQWPKTDELAYWLFAGEMDGRHPSGTFGVTMAIRWDSGRGPVLWLMNNHSLGNHEYVNECAHT